MNNLSYNTRNSGYSSFFEGAYRYGFNGHEKDDEAKGAGNTYDFGLRIYDPRLGRMFSIDPFSQDYSWQSPYAYHRNNLIAWIDYLGGGDPPHPEKINGVYFVKLKNPTAKIIENYGMSTFTHKVMMQSYIPDDFSTGYSVNLQQYDISYTNAAFRLLSPSTGANEAKILGQNVQDGKVTGSKTSDNRGYLAQDQNGNWTGGLGNPPEDSKVAFGGGIPIIVAGRKYGEKAENGILSSKGYANQNSKDVGKVIIGYNSTDKSMMLVVSPDELEKGGMTLDAIRDKLANEGYDYVFGFDGGSSSTLIKGGSTKYVEPEWYKDNTIPTGVTITGDK